MVFRVLYRTGQVSTNKPNASTAFDFTGAAAAPLAFSFASRGLATGDTIAYFADNGAGAWERGIGTWNATTSDLARTTLRESSTGSFINWSSGANNPTVWSDGRQDEDFPSYDKETDVLHVQEVRGQGPSAFIVYAGAGQSMFMGSGDNEAGVAGEMQIFGGIGSIRGGSFLLAGGGAVTASDGDGGNCDLYAGYGDGVGVNGGLTLYSGLFGGSSGLRILDNLSEVKIGFFDSFDGAVQQTLPANLTGTPTNTQLRDAVNSIMTALRTSTLMV